MRIITDRQLSNRRRVARGAGSRRRCVCVRTTVCEQHAAAAADGGGTSCCMVRACTRSWLARFIARVGRRVSIAFRLTDADGQLFSPSTTSGDSRYIPRCALSFSLCASCFRQPASIVRIVFVESAKPSFAVFEPERINPLR